MMLVLLVSTEISHLLVPVFDSSGLLSIENVHGPLGGVESIEGFLSSDNFSQFETRMAKSQSTNRRESLELIAVSHPLSLVH